ncbi:MAG: serine hydrolase [Actinomycetota bacterium]
MSVVPTEIASRRRIRRLACSVAALVGLGSVAVVAPAEASPLPSGPAELAQPAGPVPSTGEAWPAVEAEIDDLLQEFVAEFNLPGASVAASKDGRLVVSKGYGYANTEDGTLMDSDHQVLLASVTKPLITGPTVVEAMTEAGLPLDTPLYGQGGVYGTRFDADIAIGAANTGTPIEWYAAITVQHLLDHNAGFGSASKSGTMALFGIEEDELTYELVHRHFLQERALLHEPGTELNDVHYSNHHFGSMKLLVEELTGQDHTEYAAAAYLEPLGLAEEIEPKKNPYRPSTADTHEYVDGEPVPFVQDHSGGLGSFAGGYRGSVEDMVELMGHLADRYSPYELDRMGFWRSGVTPDMAWGDASIARLSHNGIISGSRVYVYMTVDGINFAIQTHISNGEAKLAMPGLFTEISNLLRDQDIPTHYDIWTGCTRPAMASGYAQVARHGTPAADYQCLFDQMTGAGYELDWLDVSTVGGRNIFNTVFVPDDGDSWRAFHGLDGAAYQDLFDQQVAKGMAPTRVDSYPVAGGVRYAGVFEPATAPFVAYHGLTKRAHQARFDELVADGYSPTSLSVVPVDGSIRYTGVYEKGVPGSFLVRSTLTPAQYQDEFDAQLRRGRSPVYLNGYNDQNGDAKIVAIFRSEPTGPFLARHGMPSAEYQAEWEDATDDGFRTTVVTAYQAGRRAAYAAVWRQ